MRYLVYIFLFLFAIESGFASVPMVEGGEEAVLVQEDTLINSIEKQKMSIIDYKFKPTSLILPASLIAVGAVGTAIDDMNDFHLFSRKDSVKQIHIDDYMEWGMLGWVFVCDLMGKGITCVNYFVRSNIISLLRFTNLAIASVESG